MADPLAIVVSISGAVAVGTEALAQLYLFIKSVRYASDNIHNLAREIQDLCSVLEKLEKKFSSGVRHKELWADLKEVLISCRNLFARLKGIVKAHRIRSDDGWFLRQWKRGKWTLQEREVTYLRSQLEAHKATLKITLLLSAHTEASSVKDTTDRIEEAVREVIDRLIQWGDGEGTAATCKSSFILQRYLSSANSIFSSPPSSPTEEERFGFKSITEEAGDQQIKIEDIIQDERAGRKVGTGIFGAYKDDLSEETHKPQRRLKRFQSKADIRKQEKESSKLEKLHIKELNSKPFELLQQQKEIVAEDEERIDEDKIDEEIARVEAEVKILLEKGAVVERVEEAEEKAEARAVAPCGDNSSEKFRKLQLQLDQLRAKVDKQKNDEENASLPSYEDMDGKGRGEAEIDLKEKTQIIVGHKQVSHEMVNHKRRTYTKFSKAHLCKEVLDEQKITYTEKSDYFLVHRVVDKTEQNYLWNRSKEIRSDYKQSKDTADDISIISSPSITCVNYVEIGGFVFVKK